MKTVLRLPFPPSVNNLYVNGKRGRFTSERYVHWQAEALAMFLQQPARLDRHTHPVSVVYTFGQPDKRRRDVFNLEKAVSDFLVKQGVLADDSLIHRGTVQWGEVSGVLVEVVSICNSVNGL